MNRVAAEGENPGVGVAGADRRIGVVDDPVGLGQEGRCPGPDLADLPAFEALKVQTASLREASVFQQPIEHFPPGAEIIFGLAQSYVVLDDQADQSITPSVFSINATYSYGKKTFSEMTTIDLRPYSASMKPPSAIADELKKIREQLEEIAKRD